MTAAAMLPRASAGAWPRHLGVLAAAIAALLALFARDAGDMARIWWTSTTFGHCLFIVPVVAWLVWTRADALARIAPVGWLPGLVIVAGGAAMWLVGDAAGVGLVRQLALVAMIEGAAVACLGPNVARALLFPLAFLFFAVPFGEELEPPLQTVTVAITMPLLHLVGVPATQDGVLIHAGRYYFEVAEACSGAKFVIAMLAFGTLVANVCFASWRRRAWWMVACLVVPVLANGVRAFGTIWAAHLTSVEAATGFDHIVYGWVFFAIVMAALMAGAWRWFDRAPDDAVVDPARLTAVPRLRVEAIVAGLLTVGIATLAVTTAHALAARRATLPDAIALPDVPGWHAVATEQAAPWHPWHPGADRRLIGSYADASGTRVDLAIAVYAHQEEGAELIAFGTGALRENDPWVRVAVVDAPAGGSAMRVVTRRADGKVVERVIAWWYRVGDMTTADPARVKLATARARLFGAPVPASALYVSAEGDAPAASAAIARFVAALGDPGTVAARIASPPQGR